MGMINKVKDYMSRPYSKGDYYAGIAGVTLLYGGLAAVYFIKVKLNEKKAKANAEPEYVNDETNADNVCEAVGNVEEEAEA